MAVDHPTRADAFRGVFEQMATRVLGHERTCGRNRGRVTLCTCSQGSVERDKSCHRRLGETCIHSKKSRTDMAERTKYQQSIIKNYYQNQEAISLQKLGGILQDIRRTP